MGDYSCIFFSYYVCTLTGPRSVELISFLTVHVEFVNKLSVDVKYFELFTGYRAAK